MASNAKDRTLHEIKQSLERIEQLLESVDWKLPDRGLHALGHSTDNGEEKRSKTEAAILGSR